MTNADIVRDFYATFNPDHLDEDVEWRLAEGFPSEGHYRGRAGVFEQWWPRHTAIFTDWKAEPAHYAEGEGLVVVLGTYVGTSPVGESLTVPFVHVWWMKDGKVAAFEQHTNTLTVHRAFVEQRVLEPA